LEGGKWDIRANSICCSCTIWRDLSYFALLTGNWQNLLLGEISGSGKSETNSEFVITERKR